MVTSEVRRVSPSKTWHNLILSGRVRTFVDSVPEVAMPYVWWVCWQVLARSPTPRTLACMVRDDFHASIPLEPVRNKALVIYKLDGKPLDDSAGGPFRFFVPDHAACHTDEIDECANVKFLDHIELTVGKGFDNRPQDDEEHAHLHKNE